jgi:hypothetical protein
MRRSRITGRFKAARLSLLGVPAKSAPHVRGNATRKARHRALVWAVKAQLDRECGR